MIAKILAFVLLSLGALVGVGILSSHFPSLASTAGHIGESAVSYGNILFCAAVGCVIWITAKV